MSNTEDVPPLLTIIITRKAFDMDIGESPKAGFGLILFRAVRVIIVLAVAIGIAQFLYSQKKEPEKKEVVVSPPGVKAVKVFPQSKVMTVTAYGTVKPRKQVKITVEVPGRIVYAHPQFVEGGPVEKGDVLIRLDPRSFLLDRQSAKARMEQANADIANLNQETTNLEADLQLIEKNLELAAKELERVSALRKNEFASQNMLEKVQQQYLQAQITLQNVKNRLASSATLLDVKRAGLDMAAADFDKANLAFEKSSIKADFGGYIVEKYAEVGEVVNPGQMIGTYYEKGRLDVDVSIPMEKMKWIQSAFENGRTPDAKIALPNSENNLPHVWDAKVARIKANVDERTRTLPMTLEISIPNGGEKGLFNLKPGTFVQCTILGRTIEQLYVMPRFLVKSGDVVYTVKDNRLAIKDVRILRKFENEVYINAGLEPGDQVISSPLPGALDGMALALIKNGLEEGGK